MGREEAFGALALVFSICLVIIGFPAQILKNHKDKRCGQPLSIILLALGVYVARIPYVFLKGAYFILPSDVAGAILSGVILYQYFHYREMVKPQGKTIVDQLYPPPDIYVTSTEFSPNPVGIVITCIVPSTASYMLRPTSYVPAESLIRCVAQGTYELIEHALAHAVLPFKIDVDTYREIGGRHLFWFWKESLTFHKQAKRDEPFTLDLRLKKVREITLEGRHYRLIILTIGGAVVSGEASFIYVEPQ